MLGITSEAIAKNYSFAQMDRFLTSSSKINITIAITVSQALLLYGDFLTGPWVPFTVFYLCTLYFAIKYLGIRTALAMAFVIVSIKTYIKVSHVSITMLWWEGIWQLISSYLIYAFFCYLIDNQLSARRRAEEIAVSATHRAGEAERQLLNISEETQQRLGRELHDDLGQHLTAISFTTQVLLHKLEAAGREELADASKLSLMLNQAICKTRNLAHGLYPEEIREQGFNNMIEKFTVHVEEMYSVSCLFFSDKNFQLASQEVATHLFRITQEAVNNAIRHGQATQIILRMSLLPFSQVFEILDNGRGLDINNANLAKGLGMRSMRYRTDLIGAALDISARAGGGTQVAIRMPFKP